MKKIFRKKSTKIISGVILSVLLITGFTFQVSSITDANKKQAVLKADKLKDKVDINEVLGIKDVEVNDMKPIEEKDVDKDKAKSNTNDSKKASTSNSNNSTSSSSKSNSSNSTNKPASSSNSSKPGSKPAPSKPAPSKPAPTCSTKTINHPAEYKTVKGSPAVYEKQTWFGFNDGKVFINDAAAANSYAANTGQGYSIITKNVEVKPAVPDKKVLVKAAWTETVKVCN